MGRMPACSIPLVPNNKFQHSLQRPTSQISDRFGCRSLRYSVLVWVVPTSVTMVSLASSTVAARGLVQPLRPAVHGRLSPSRTRSGVAFNDGGKCLGSGYRLSVHPALPPRYRVSGSVQVHGPVFVGVSTFSLSSCATIFSASASSSRRLAPCFFVGIPMQSVGGQLATLKLPGCVSFFEPNCLKAPFSVFCCLAAYVPAPPARPQGPTSPLGLYMTIGADRRPERGALRVQPSAERALRISVGLADTMLLFSSFTRQA